MDDAEPDRRGVFAVAGVPVALDVRTRDADGRLARAGIDELAGAALGGLRPAEARPVLRVTLRDDVARLPVDHPDDELDGTRLWVRRDEVVVGAGAVVGFARDDSITYHVTSRDDAALVERIAPVLLAWVLARRDRFVIHGAAVARRGEAILVLGSSGAGKSTLVAAALEHGWLGLSDDIVVLDGSAGDWRVHGLHREPAVPVEIGGPMTDGGARHDDPRGRVMLPRSVLSADPAVAVAVAVVGHAPEAGGALRRLGGRHVMPLLLQSFPAMVDDARRAQFFDVATSVVALPTWELGHAADVTRRRAHAARAIDEIVAQGAPRRALSPDVR